MLYYALPVAAATISADTGWRLSHVMAAYGGGQLVTAAVSPVVGRLIDRFGPRPVMTAGSVAATGAAAAIGLAPAYPVFLASWVLAGTAMSAVLYPPAFAAINAWAQPQHRVQALTTVTLVGGLASTAFAPLTGVLLEQLGWRHTFLALAAILLLTAPTHFWGLRAPWQRPGPRAPGPAVWRSRAFILLALALSWSALCMFGVMTNLVPMVQSHGIDLRTASLILGVVGLGQVTGRLGYAPLRRHTSVTTSTIAVIGLGAVTSVALALLPGQVAVLAVATFVLGLARGCNTLVQATAVVDRWGTHRVGSLTGALSAPIMAATAVGPWFGAVVAEGTGSYPVSFLVMGLLGLLAAALVPLTFPPRPGALAGRTP